MTSMPPKTQIPKEKILRTGLDLVIREGYEVINIKRLGAGDRMFDTADLLVVWQHGNIS